MRFQLFVALRYLRSGGHRAVVSVATLVSVAGVTAGVAALHIALALNEGIQNEFLTRILGATSHISVRSLTSSVISDFETVSRRLESLPDIKEVAPAASGYALFRSFLREQPAIVKGVDLTQAEQYQAVVSNIVDGSLDEFQRVEGAPVIILGKELASSLDVQVGEFILTFGTRGEVTPVGRIARRTTFEVIAIYETGLWDYDYNLALVPLSTAQDFLGYSHEQTSLLEIRLADIDLADSAAERIRNELGISYQVSTWAEINRPLFSALRLEKLALTIAIGLIVLVASLNIVSTLTLMVVDKGRDIAIIMSMGGSAPTIRGIFMLQGLVIGLLGALLGCVVGLTISHYLDVYQAIPLDPQVYQITYVPFRPRVADLLLVSGAAILISFAATLYPSRTASRLDPVVALRND